MGGFIPDVLLNLQRTRFVPKVLPQLQEMIDKKNYRDARVDFIQEK
jgi:hypothetical protein